MGESDLSFSLGFCSSEELRSLFALVTVVITIGSRKAKSFLLHPVVNVSLSISFSLDARKMERGKGTNTNEKRLRPMKNIETRRMKIPQTADSEETAYINLSPSLQFIQML
jgi:hypothetical protein